MANDSVKPRIVLHPHNRRVQVKLGDTLLAETTSAIEIHERGYPLRHYLPCEEARMEWLARSHKVIRYFYKWRIQEHMLTQVLYAGPLWIVTGYFLPFISIISFSKPPFMQLPP
ncbi:MULTISPECIES: DUF427 domain-containing protein [Halomonadaceae]|uniref:DUF427 domain-containing protein n=1 Tax=Halomonadaceae TaxID=28256 RepID=UPI001598065D|nr:MULTISPECIES: DUF427 domain-containing protein [Halomonas]QJQ95134.1 DUF427 domain-containing protein [Halomonas sp. PA5]